MLINKDCKRPPSITSSQSSPSTPSSPSTSMSTTQLQTQASSAKPTASSSTSSRPTEYPSVPHPSASPVETHAFLTELLFVNHHSRSRAEADTLANKVTGNGAFFYRIPLRIWMEAYGSEGLFIYELLQESKYGYSGMAIVGRFLDGLGQQVSTQGSSLLEQGNALWTKIRETLHSQTHPQQRPTRESRRDRGQEEREDESTRRK